jgi:AraC family transcriptional regulator, regulatory protein of adaptative response / DNA-3-methyladenine glycosylase II
MDDGDPARYRAYASRDPRFDGMFFIGVTSTGIYCRPVCTAKTPRAGNCRFFQSAAAAERAGFRPCLRCRPELSPGAAPVDDARRVAGLVLRRIEESMLDGAVSLDELAAQFELSARQLRRIVRDELGASPMELLSTRRLLLAKQLLTETRLPITEVAFASGFASLRRFNDAFRARYAMPPGRLRRAGAAVEATEALTLRLAYRPPYDWAALLDFLRARAIAGVERVDADTYARTARLGAARGWVRVRHAPAERALVVEVSPALMLALPALLRRVRDVFDLDARPDLVAAHLAGDPRLRAAVARSPGLRVPGAFDGFELAARAVLGQQVSVKAATTLAGRFASAFGEAVDGAPEGLHRLTPTAERVARASVAELRALGVVELRARALLGLADAMARGSLRVEAGAPAAETVAALAALPGIGPWTAQYVALRALRWPDAFPREDLALRSALGGVSAAGAEAIAEAWRPWRSYATLHLWRGETS